VYVSSREAKYARKLAEVLGKNCGKANKRRVGGRRTRTGSEPDYYVRY
jgi:hypothetical protein